MKFLLAVMLTFIILPAQQVGYIEYNHPVYDFLLRMETLNIISDYNGSELPKTRKEISDYLIEVREQSAQLNEVDNKRLADLLVEFELDIEGTTNNYHSLISDFGFNKLISEKEKFLYYSADSSSGSIFVNFVGESSYLYDNNRITDAKRNAALYKFGGMVRGTIGNNFGFYIKATNGTFRGNKALTLEHSELKYNYKYSSNPATQTGTEFFDDTEGYFMADFDNAVLKIGRDRNLLGYGNIKTVLGDNTPPMDYISLNLKYSILKYSFIHGKLLGSESFHSDQVQGGIREVEEKFFVYHRLGLDFGKHLSLGLGEMVIYSRRSMDLSYLNPFNFYKSVEHLNQDRDNTLLFVDLKNNSFPGLMLFASLILDDMDFSKIGSGWYGNKVLWNIGFNSTLLYDFFPVDFGFQYLRIEPYVYSHRISDNNYSTLGYSLVSPLQPNSQVFSFDLKYYPVHRLSVKLNFRYVEHGANRMNSEGELIDNYGGDVLFGHRPDDPDEIEFLEGLREHYRETLLEIIYEPVNNYFIKCNLHYNNSSLAGGGNKEFVYSMLTASIRI